jgi:hypothetical protein
MSWYKKRPKVKEQPKQRPHHTSPATERALKELKKQVTPTGKSQ